MLKIRFSANILPLSWVVRAWCLSKVSHVEFIFDDGTTILPSIGLNRTVLTISRPYTWNWDFAIDISKEEELKILDWCKSQIGVPYDLTALAPLNILIPRKKKNWYDPSHWMCSEFCAYALHFVGYKLFDLDTKKITPGQFYKKFKASKIAIPIKNKNQLFQETTSIK